MPLEPKCIACGKHGHTYDRCPNVSFGKLYTNGLGTVSLQEQAEVAEAIETLSIDPRSEHATE